MKIYIVTFLSETYNLNSADSFVFSSEEKAWKFIEADADMYAKDFDAIEYDRRNYELVYASGDEYFTWTIKEVEIDTI